VSALFLFLSGLLAVALCLEPLTERLRLPFPTVLVLVGFIGSEAVVRLGWDTGLRADNFNDLVVYVFLPVLIFATALGLDPRLLRRNLVPVLLLAIPLLLLSTGTIALLVYLGIGHPTGFPWPAALITGALLSATDPAAVAHLLRHLGGPERLVILLEGEGLFNDAAAVVLFEVFLSTALHTGPTRSLTDLLREFLAGLCGGLAVGLGVAAVALLVLRWRRGPRYEALVVGLIAAYAAYLTSEAVVHVSGVMAVLATGLVLGAALRRPTRGGDARAGSPEPAQWAFNANLADDLLFILMGATVTVSMFEERWLAMLIAIGGILAARTGVYLLMPLAAHLPPRAAIPRAYQTALYWGGCRGAVTLALALALPVDLDYWWTIQSIAFGVVVFNLFLQVPTTAPLLRHLRLTDAHCDAPGGQR
jgi:CPA1 family monovalent cation:H+ antiporter